MKINSQNQLGLNFTQETKDKFYNLQSEKYFNKLPSELAEPYRQQWLGLLSDEKNKNLFFTKTALEIAEKIKIDKFEPSILKIKKEKKFTFLIDNNNFYRVNLKQDEILTIHVKKTNLDNGMSWLSYDAFKIMPLLNTVIYPNNNQNYMEEKVFKDFLKLLIFTEYSEIVETVLKPNHSIGTRRQGKYLNDSKNDFVIVDSTWNKVIIRDSSFGVVGHFRLQPYGKNREERKLIYIKEHTKKGYIRKPKGKE